MYYCLGRDGMGEGGEENSLPGHVKVQTRHTTSLVLVRSLRAVLHPRFPPLKHHPPLPPLEAASNKSEIKTTAS